MSGDPDWHYGDSPVYIACLLQSCCSGFNRHRKHQFLRLWLVQRVWPGKHHHNIKPVLLLLSTHTHRIVYLLIQKDFLFPFWEWNTPTNTTSCVLSLILQADLRSNLGDAGYVVFGVILFVWELLPTSLVVFFFRVRKPAQDRVRHKGWACQRKQLCRNAVSLTLNDIWRLIMKGGL